MSKLARDAFVEAIELMGKKEALLSELVGWLKAKGLWEQAIRDLGWKITKG